MRRQGKGWIKETFLSCIIGKVVRVKSLYAWQFMPAIAELWKLKQEDCHGFKPNLGHTEFQINLSHNETLSYLLSPKSEMSSAQQSNFKNPVSYFCTCICSNTFSQSKTLHLNVKICIGREEMRAHCHYFKLHSNASLCIP